MIERTRSERIASYVLYALLGCVLFMGLNAAMLSRVVVPEYDALSYTDAALRVHLGLAGAGFDKLTQTGALGSVVWVGLPFTNTLDVFALALLFDVVDYHIGVWLIHSAYVVLFAWLARRLLGSAAALALFIAYLFHEDIARHRTALAWITVLLLFARTINLLFIGPLVVVHVALRWRHRRAEAIAALKAVGLAVLILSPMLVYHGYYMVQYMAKMGNTGVIQNWRDMTGVYNKIDLLRAYRDGLLQYHPVLCAIFGAALLGGVAFYFTRGRPARLRYFRDGMLALVVVFAVLMQAETNNVMVVYWVFILAGLCLTLLLRGMLKEHYLLIAGIVLAAFALRQSGLNYLHHNRELVRGRPVIEMANTLAKRLAAVEGPQLFSNFSGVGALDAYGFELALGRTIAVPVVNALSYDTPVDAYITAIKQANVSFVANRSFLWPPYVGINRKTEEIARIMESEGTKMGFQKVERILFDWDASRYVDVYIRPAALVKLKYGWANDMWLDAETTVIIKAQGDSLAGFVLNIDVQVPGGVSDPGYTFPFAATLSDMDGRRRVSVVVGGPGDGTLSFPLDGIPAGVYRLKFDKTFKPSANDNRQLAVLYRGSRVAYGKDGK